MNINPAKLAGVALQVMGAATIQATDDNLDNVSAARMLLKGIQSGQLVVMPAPAPAEPPAPPGAPIARAVMKAVQKGQKGQKE